MADDDTDSENVFQSWLKQKQEPPPGDPLQQPQLTKPTPAPSSNSPYGDQIAKAEKDNNIPTGLLNHLLYTESNFNKDALNPSSNATGIAQILPSTAANPGYGIAPVDPTDPNASIDFAGKYLAARYKQAGTWQGAVQGYGTVDQNGPTNERQKQLWDMAGAADQPGLQAQAKPSLEPTFQDTGTEFADFLHPKTQYDESWLARKFEHSWRETEQFGVGLAGLASSVFGSEESTKDVMTLYNSLGKRADEIAPRYNNLQDLRAYGGVGDWADYLASKTFDAVPDIAMMMGSGGVGSWIAKKAVEVGGKELAEEALASIGRRAALAGNYLSASTQEMSGIAGEQYQATGKINPGVAIAAGAIAGVPAAMAPAALGARLGLVPKAAGEFVNFVQDGLTKALGDNWATRGLGSVLGYGIESGTASAAQSTIESLARQYVDKNYHALGPEGIQRIVNATFDGTLLGGVLGLSGFARDPRIQAIEDHVRNALGGGPSTPVESSQPVVTTGTEALKKWLPESSNKSVETMNQVLREQFGNPDNMPTWMKNTLEKNPQSLETMNLLKAAVEQHIRGSMIGKDITSDDNQTMHVDHADVNLKDETITLADKDSGATKTVPLDQLPLRDLAKNAIDYLDKTKAPWMSATHKELLNPSYGGNRGDKTIDWSQIVNAHAGDPATDRMNRPVDLTQGLKPGQVAYTWRAADHDESPLAPITRRVAEWVMKKYAPNASLLIDSSKGGENPVTKTAGGFIHSMGDGAYYIALPTDTGLRGVTTLFHELGHLVSFDSFHKLPIGTKQAVYLSYARHLKDFENKDLKEFFQSSLHPSRMPGLDDPNRVGRLNKWFDFEEHMAEQFATHFMFGPGRNAVDKFFNGASKKILDVLQQQKLVDPNYNPSAHEAMAGWLDTVYRNHNPVNAEAFLKHTLESSAENAKAMGIKPDPSESALDRITQAPPANPAMATVHAASKAGLISPKFKAQADKFGWWTRWLWDAQQTARLNQHIEPLRRVAEYFGQFNADRMVWGQRANDVLKAWRRLGRDTGGKLDDLFFSLDKGEYLKPGEASRKPNPADMSATLKRLNISPDQWKRMQPVHDMATKMFSDALDRMEENAVADAKGIRDPVAQQTRLNETAAEFASLRNRAYFPHSRYGDYSVGVKDPRGRLVHYEHVWTERDAIKRAKELQNQFGPTHLVRTDKVPEEMRQWVGMPPSMLAKLRNMPGMTATQQGWLDNFIYDMSPANSFVQRMQRRKDIAGYDVNGPRSFATYFRAASGHLARLKFMDKINRGVQDLDKSRLTDFSPTDIAGISKRRNMAEWLGKAAEYVLHPPNENAAIRSLAFNWWLSFNPSTAFVHLMQMPMFTAPYMSKYYGANGIKHMVKAYGDMRQVYRDPAKSKLEPDWIWAQDRLQHEGVLTESRGTDMAALTEQGMMANSLRGTKFHKLMINAANFTSMFLRPVERNNRVLSGLAAFRSAMEDPTNTRLKDLVNFNSTAFNELINEGKSPQVAAAYIAARDVIQQTHFRYTQVARPQIFRGALSKFTPFMMYKQQALFFFMHNPAGLRALAMVGAVSGLQGMPFEEDASGIIKSISEWLFGTRFDPNEEIRKQVAQLTDHPEYLMHGFGREGLGIPALFNSMGLPAPIGDVSQRLGYGSLIPGIDALSRDQRESFMERFGNSFGNLMGAGMEVPIGLASAISQLNVPYTLQRIFEDGDLTGLRGLEPIMPSVLRNASMALRYYEMGGDVTQTGEKRVPMDMTDSSGLTQAWARFMGFSSPKVAEMIERKDMTSQVQSYWLLRKQRIMQDFVQSRLMNDPATIKSTMERVQEYNRDSPFGRMKIRPQGLIAAVKRQAITNVMQARGVDKQGIAQAIAQQFPELSPQTAGMETQSDLLAP